MQRRDVLKGLSLMLGGGLSSACQHALQAAPEARRVERAVYDEAHQAIAHRVTDMIIPPTDTPGALQAGVGDFIDYVVTVWFNDDEQAQFMASLTGLEESAQRIYAGSFTALAPERQIMLLEAIQDSEFFSQIKELTVVGFYTSEIGATQERKYVPMPGYYDGYYKLADVGRQWSS